jgi:hypothetical protein
MIDPSRRLAPSIAPEDHPIHDAAEAGELARVRAFLDRQPSLVDDINRAGGHPLHRRVIGGSADVVKLLLDRGADIHAIHGAGVGSFAGYAPQDKQPIDLAIWGGPRQAPLSRWRCYASGLTWLLWRRWRPGRRSMIHRPPATILVAQLVKQRHSINRWVIRIEVDRHRGLPESARRNLARGPEF